MTDGKPISQAKYLKEGDCPVCENDVFEGGPIDINGGQATQNVHCVTCGSYWTDVYRLIQYDNLHAEDGTEIDIPGVDDEE